MKKNFFEKSDKLENTALIAIVWDKFGSSMSFVNKAILSLN